MATLINRTKALAAQSNTKFKLVVGHGALTGTYERLPEDTYIIFLSKPGHLISQGSITQHPQMFRHSYLRNAISGVLPKWSIQPTRLGMWKEHVYGPANLYPDMIINFFDHTVRGLRTQGTPYNNVSGVHAINANRKVTYFKGSTANLSNIIRFRGKGIYIVAACRASPERSFAGAMGSFRRNIRSTRGNQTSLRRMGPTDPARNRAAQLHENKQARMAAHKRMSNFPNRNTPSKKMKPMFMFAPGLPTPAASTRRRTPAASTRRRTPAASTRRPRTLRQI